MAVTVTVTAKESAAGLWSSWDQCSEPKEIRMGLREARKQAKCKSRRDQLPVKVCLSFLWCVGRTGSKVRTAVSDENRCSLGLNVGHGGRGRGGRKLKKGKGRAIASKIEYPQPFIYLILFLWWKISNTHPSKGNSKNEPPFAHHLTSTTIPTLNPYFIPCPQASL